MNETAPLIKEDSASEETLRLTDELAARYSLDKWASGFSLMTAGYRDRLDPADAFSSKAPFNVVTVAILAEAKARVFKRKLAAGETDHVHLGGETRPHTQTFIRIASRIYAKHGFHVHLRQGPRTTPIWYTSFGVFYEGYQSGDNFTASHSRCDKGGWKPVDSSGQQLLAEEQEIIAEVQSLVKSRAAITLAPWQGNSLIAEDFNVDEAYIRFQRLVLGNDFVEQILNAGRAGFKCAACTMGGSMKGTSERLFKLLGIPTGKGGVVDYYYGEESSEYHKIGQVGTENYGVDPSNPRIYRSLGAQEKLLSHEADLVILWDPDGDRINIVTRAPSKIAAAAVDAGLEVDAKKTESETIIYFTPNQLYLMLSAFRLERMRAQGKISEGGWMLGLSYPTTKSLEEMTAPEGLKCVRVPVGFKYIGQLCQTIEKQLNGKDSVIFESSIGDRTDLGVTPHALILCEESGGATLGGSELFPNRSGTRRMLALREKDAMQLGLMTLTIAAALHQKGISFAEYYCDLVAKKGLKFIYYSRKDMLLYNEGLIGAALEKAREEGVKKRDQVMDLFGNFADRVKEGALTLDGLADELNRLAPPGSFKISGLKRACRAGEDLLHGTLFEAENYRFLVRASGTDAVLRYYVEGCSKSDVAALQDTLVSMQPK